MLGKIHECTLFCKCEESSHWLVIHKEIMTRCISKIMLPVKRYRELGKHTNSRSESAVR